MTRETKLGLVVAGSFLALVGGVVVTRLWQVDLPGDGAEVAAANGAETNPPAADPPTPAPDKQEQPVPSDALA